MTAVARRDNRVYEGGRDIRQYGNVGPAILAMRFADTDWQTIADTLGLANADIAHQLFLDELAERIPADGDREVMRAEASAMLRGLLGAVYPRATDREDPEQLFAVQRATALVDRLIKLHGTDAPSEVIVHTPTTSEIDSWVRQMVGSAVEVDVVEADVVDMGDPDAADAAPADR